MMKVLENKIVVFGLIIILSIYYSNAQKYNNGAYKVLKPFGKMFPKMVNIQGMREYDTNLNIIAPYAYSYGFAISTHEITNQEFCEFLNHKSIKPNDSLINKTINIKDSDCKIVFEKNKFKPIKGFEDFPVVFVTWYGANEYCNWMTQIVNDYREKRGLFKLPKYRLPTEFEWSVSIKSGDSCKTINEISVGKPKSWQHSIMSDNGIYGINDNVFEWTSDDYEGNNSMNDVETRDFNSFAIVRCFNCKSIFCRDALCGRKYNVKTSGFSNVGFRIVQTTQGRAMGGEF